MKKTESVLKTTLFMSPNEKKLFKISKVWDGSKKKLGICLLKAGTTSMIGGG